MRFSRAGSWTAHISLSDGRASDHPRNTEAPPPAYGNQNSRSRACGFGFGQITQVSTFCFDIIVCRVRSLNCNPHKHVSIHWEELAIGVSIAERSLNCNPHKHVACEL